MQVGSSAGACGLAQRWGDSIEETRPGDVIWFPPGEKHWHGATATTAMTHIAILEALDGKAVDWMENVTDSSTRQSIMGAIGEPFTSCTLYATF